VKNKATSAKYDLAYFVSDTRERLLRIADELALRLRANPDSPFSAALVQAQSFVKQAAAVLPRVRQKPLAARQVQEGD
jgi:hypothetical protein